MNKYKLGRNPVIYDPYRKFLAKYLNRSIVKLPTTVALDLSKDPKVVDGMLFNGPDPLNPPQVSGGAGCCFWSASLRAAVARANSAGKVFDLTEAWAVASVIEAYSKCTGFDVNNAANTDNGTDPGQGFTYLTNVGIRLQDGTYDKIGPHVSVNAKDIEEVYIAHNLFGGLYVGVQFPGAWEDADVWDITSSEIEGGHEIVCLSDVSVTPNGIVIDSWGMKRVITAAALAQYCDQLTAVVDPAFFGPNGIAINGFDAEQLAADEAAIQ